MTNDLQHKESVAGGITSRPFLISAHQCFEISHIPIIAKLDGAASR